jgi:hypothetical protein
MYYTRYELSPLLSVSVNTPKTRESFNLTIHINDTGSASNDRFGYTAYSELTPTTLEKIAKRFTGPNQQHEQYPK